MVFVYIDYTYHLKAGNWLQNKSLSSYFDPKSLIIIGDVILINNSINSKQEKTF